MVEDPKWELALLATVQGFYQRLLSDHLGGELPIPAALASDSICHIDEAAAILQKMQLWIQLLDMAITPAMLRNGVTDMDPEVAEALLRYLVRRRVDTADSRDKTDLIATYLFRHPRVAGQWQLRGYGLDGSVPLSPFAIALLEILSEFDLPELSDDDVQYLRELDPLLQQANRLQDFGALMDSGIIQRVRDLKSYLGESIYHPSVLATLAPYNAAFGEHFATLFSAATREIKDFASHLEKLGGAILGTVDGIQVTVEDVHALDQEALLKVDYRTALQKFCRVARLKKELERRPPLLSKTTPGRSRSNAAVAAHAVDAGGAAAAPAPIPALTPALTLKYAPPAISSQALAAEEAKLRRVEESIRVFVRVADPKLRQIVPMHYFNLLLAPAEVAAYTADYLDQSGPRAEAARMLIRLVAATARITTEMEELKRSATSRSLWKLHADSMVVLLHLARRLAEAAEQVGEGIREQPEVESSGNAIRDCLEKLRARIAEAEPLTAAAAISQA